jgi:hypothetical protein
MHSVRLHSVVLKGGRQRQAIEAEHRVKEVRIRSMFKIRHWTEAGNSQTENVSIRRAVRHHTMRRVVACVPPTCS